MRIKFLGTSATWPLPRSKKCQCPLCQSLDSRDKRLRSVLLIKEDNLNLLIDCGPDIVKEIRREKIESINAIIITHAHSDHISGLKRINFKALHQNETIPIYASFNAHRIIKKNFGQKINYQKKIIFPYRAFKINRVKFRPLLVNHYQGVVTFAFKINFKDKNKNLKLIYMPDYKEISLKTANYIKGCDLLILGGSILSKKIPWHKSIIEGIELAKLLKAKKVYFTHIGHDTLPHKELEKFVREKGGENFHIGYDGLEIKLT